MHPNSRRRGLLLALTGLVMLQPVRLLAQGGLTVERSGQQRQIFAETPEQHNERMRWWREAKFGLFIHWGVYAVPAGRYGGKSQYGEWIMRQANIPRADYRTLARQFVPSNYDPKAWARLAKAAGMRYLVITAKHHEGFALYPSAVTDWDLADASPYGKDVLAPLAEAARAEGLKFGLYYSQAMDWMHPGGGIVGQPWDETHQGDFDRYLDTIAVPQVRELLARYHPDVLWWDTPVNMTPERADRFAAVVRKQPGLITNSRLGGGYPGDMQTPEQFIPLTPPGGDWETCMTMNGHWGYNEADQNWKSAETLIRMLAEICGKGGNFLLNVGPTATGEIPSISLARLADLGRWLETNGEAIYGTTAGPFSHVSWGTATRKGHRLFLHVFDWPSDGRLRVPLQNKATAAHLLQAPGTPLACSHEENRIVIHVPTGAPDPIDSIVVLDLADEPRATPIPSYGKPVRASSSETNHPAEHVVDSSITSTWHPIKGEQSDKAWLEIDLQAPTTLAGFGLGEPDVWPRLKQTYVMAAKVEGKWQTIAQGTTGGHGERGAFTNLTAQQVRIEISSPKGRVGLSELQLYGPE